MFEGNLKRFGPFFLIWFAHICIWGQNSPCDCSDVAGCGAQLFSEHALALAKFDSDVGSISSNCVPNGWMDMTSYDLFLDQSQSHQLCGTMTTGPNTTQIGIRQLIMLRSGCSLSSISYSVLSTCASSDASYVGQDIYGGSRGFQYYDVSPNTTYRICRSVSVNNSDSDCDDSHTCSSDPELSAATIYLYISATCEGINSAPYLWLKADAGVNGTTEISAWEDQSGFGFDAGQSSSTAKPALAEAAFNFNPSIRFDGSDRMNTSFNMNYDDYPVLTVLAVYRPDIDNAGGLWGEDNGSWDRFMLDGNSSSLNNMISDGSGSNNHIPNLFVPGQTNLATVTFEQGSVGGSVIYVNGSKEGTFTASQSSSSANLQIGDIGSGLYPFDGDIAELMVFASEFSSGEREKLQSYLGLKYGLTLSQNYISAKGTTFWTFDEHYSNQIFGLGRDDCYDLDQRISKSSESGAFLEVYLGDVTASFPSQNSDNSQAFSSDNQFLIISDNQGDVGSLNQSIQDGRQVSVSRIWKVVETGSMGTVTLRFAKSALPAATGRLYINSSQDVSFPDDVNTTNYAMTDNGTYLYIAVNLSNGDLFTFGDGSAVVLGNYTLDLEGKPIYGGVLLNWESPPDPSIDYFVVERSVLPGVFEAIGTVKPQSAAETQFEFVDYEIFGLNHNRYYYRIKQFNRDGNVYYSTIKDVSIQAANLLSLEVWPNPAQDHINIQWQDSHSLALELKILNSLGQLMYSQSLSTFIPQNALQLIVDTWPSGVYYIHITNESAEKISKIVLN